MVYILFLIPMLSLFIDKCYGSGMIFRRFYLLLIRLTADINSSSMFKSFASLYVPSDIIIGCYYVHLMYIFLVFIYTVGFSPVFKQFFTLVYVNLLFL